MTNSLLMQGNQFNNLYMDNNLCMENNRNMHKGLEYNQVIQRDLNMDKLQEWMCKIITQVHL